MSSKTRLILLYTMVDEKRAPYYEQFGFRRVDVTQLPLDLLKEYRIGSLVTPFISLFRKEKVRNAPWQRD